MDRLKLRPQILRLPSLPDSHVGDDYYTLLLQIEATKGRLKGNIEALRETARQPMEFLASTRNVLQQAAQIPLKGIEALEDQIEAQPWAAMGTAAATGAVAGYFDDGRLEKYLAGLPGEIAGWLTTLVSRLTQAALGAVNQVVTQSVVGAVTGAVAAQMVNDANETPPEHRAEESFVRQPIEPDLNEHLPLAEMMTSA